MTPLQVLTWGSKPDLEVAQYEAEWCELEWDLLLIRIHQGWFMIRRALVDITDLSWRLLVEHDSSKVRQKSASPRSHNVEGIVADLFRVLG